MSIESREYQNFIIQRIEELVDSRKSVILELDCGMGKRVLMYRLVTEAFKNKKVVVFLQTHSSLEETA
ncbi:MAG: DEAD/DEAH box helicase family protein, partial [Candidatus Heimdallarchaeota archaeon]|nr:DEAD/DEAH box helicase family protein [Candidatus Heimdallarchaeota archaeon]